MFVWFLIIALFNITYSHYWSNNNVSKYITVNDNYLEQNNDNTYINFDINTDNTYIDININKTNDNFPNIWITFNINMDNNNSKYKMNQFLYIE
uniref:Uncharacterized protein n=1 Tax=viral metagenome TaxID=1070528 RepID=A0A6C0BSA0_9ZZZZ